MKIEKRESRNSFISKDNFQDRKIASSAEYRIDKQFQNYENLLILQVVKLWKFVNLPIKIIPKILNSEHS